MVYLVGLVVEGSVFDGVGVLIAAALVGVLLLLVVVLILLVVLLRLGSLALIVVFTAVGCVGLSLLIGWYDAYLGFML